MATKMLGLQDRVSIPRQTGGATAYWVAEGADLTESQAAFDQIELSPKTVGAYTEITRKLLSQSSIDIEFLVRRDLARALGLEIDRACIAGSGSGNQPTGILPRITTVNNNLIDIATNGGAPTWEKIVELETKVAQNNAEIGSLRYLTNTRVRGKLKTTKQDSNISGYVWSENNTLNGYETLVSNQIPFNLSKGTGNNLSALVFGNFADLIVGMWTGLDMLVNPYAKDLSGGIRVTVHQDLDIQIRYNESFSAIKDATT